MDSYLVSQEVESMTAYCINALMLFLRVSQLYSLQHLIGNSQRSTCLNNQKLITTNLDSRITCLTREHSQGGSFMLFGREFYYCLYHFTHSIALLISMDIKET